MNQIVGVAIKTSTGLFTLPRPNRHHNVIRLIYKEISAADRDFGTEIQGFVDSEGNFLNRKDAMKLAEVNGQLNRLAGDQYYQGPDLYSEDLW